ncbi:hypothetical protein RJ640_027948 [Escallonia rubra]|uniref:PWWP domain-containing protein n=1 Tax=Escallonia rubra TaxID=112253 RepID=A0AA88U752_9ASTE|nr:hypothetical protein RJ640_027948 [Escallonia rubra]
MGTVGTKKTETLVGSDGGPILPKPVKSQTPEAGSGDAGAGLDKSGVWVSDTNHGVLNGADSVVAKRRVVETEVPIQTNLVDGSGSNLDVEKMEENRVQEIGENSGSSVLAGEGYDKNAEVRGSGISLVVDVSGSLASGKENEEKSGFKNEKGSLAENGGVTMSEVGEKGNEVRDEEGGKQEVDANEDLGEGEGEGEEDQDHDYLVGDFVWGKIRSHPWWPGQIYDPADASDHALKLRQKDRLLVAYFEDSSFSWCNPSQLKPFAENFEEMSRQTTSKSTSQTFANAVQNALEDIGRLVELEMTCSCIPKEIRIQPGITKPNGGIKSGVVVPKGGSGKHLTARHEPAELLANVKSAAKGVFSANLLELVVLRSWLSAFYRAKGGYGLPVYCEPAYIEGLEDKKRGGEIDTNDFSEPVEVPIEDDWLSSPAEPGSSQSDQPLLQKCPDISRDKLYQRRKKKSVAKLMAEDMDVELKDTIRSLVSGKKKRRRSEEAESQGDIVSTAERKRGKKKQPEASDSLKATKNKVSRVDNPRVGAEEATGSSLSRERKGRRVSFVLDDDTEAKEETAERPASRERKQSKYLSPPYTSPKGRIRSPGSKGDTQSESEKITNITRMGERMIKVAGQLIQSPQTVDTNVKKFQKRSSAELGSGDDDSGKSSPQTSDQNVDSIEVDANEVLSELRSAALNPLHFREKRRLDMITAFNSEFRSSNFSKGSNYHNGRAGRKRKSLNSEAGPLGKHLNQIAEESIDCKTELTAVASNGQAKSDMPKVKQVVKASDKKADNKEAGDGKPEDVALILTFPPGIQLPSKDDLITMFSKFGALNEKETDVFYNSFCARVFFLRSRDAEEAFTAVSEKSPFGAANVSYRLRYPSDSSVAQELQQKTSSSLRKTPEKLVTYQPSDIEASGLRYVRQKLEKMTSMLENSVGGISPKTKDNLEGQMKGLLEEIPSTLSKQSVINRVLRSLLCTTFDCHDGTLGVLYTKFTHSSHENPAVPESRRSFSNWNSVKECRWG